MVLAPSAPPIIWPSMSVPADSSSPLNSFQSSASWSLQSASAFCMSSLSCCVPSAFVAEAASSRSHELAAVSRPFSIVFLIASRTSCSSFLSSALTLSSIFCFMSCAILSTSPLAASQNLEKNFSTSLWFDWASFKPSLAISSTAFLA